MDLRSIGILEYDKIIADLMSLAHSAPGHELCAALQPSSELATVLVRQRDTDDAVKLVLEKGVPPLGGISEIRPAVHRAGGGSVLAIHELMRIASFLQAIERIRQILPENGPGERIVYNLIAQLKPNKALRTRLDDCIAGEEELKDQASAELASLRRRIRQAQVDVKESLQRIVRSQAKALQEQLVTLRGDRYVVPVKAEHRGSIPGLVHDTSSSGSTLFVEPLPVVELNNKIRELMGLEREEIERILIELSGRVADSADALLANANLLAEIDFVIAKARLALKQKAMPPVVNDEGRIVLKAARHPLIPQARVVPINFELGQTFHSLIITGPNTGGKTVALKTCGLFCLMAMAGLQIPAREGSEVSVFEQVLADIGDEQSIEQDLSTFSAHMRNIIQITHQARPQTLVLVDELGSGTDPSEGAALAISILDYLRARDCRTVATTHYKELKGYAMNTPGVENACCEFDSETLRPTYKLLIGVPGVSNAFAISSRLGLPDPIIEQAKSLLSEEGIRFEELVSAIEKSHIEADRIRDEVQVLHEQAERDRLKFEQERQSFQDKSKAIVQQAREEARELYEVAQGEIDELLEQTRLAMKEQDAYARHDAVTKARHKARTGRGRIEGEIGQATLSASGGEVPSQLVIGQDYAAPALDLIGRLIEGTDLRGQCIIQSGAMRISVPAASLRIPKKTTTPAATIANSPLGRRRTNQDKLTMNRTMTMSPEIQLLGQTVEEALQTLDKYLDDAALTGIASVRIVHGKGTGALRAAVGQSLKRDPRVKAFRIGAYGEGDSGVTIADLK
ncbi:MAG: endonuclease MutS2 [Eubacteriales bacterium]|nr:endonuclease MutS2 [Eubacteriales bacterium]